MNAYYTLPSPAASSGGVKLSVPVFSLLLFFILSPFGGSLSAQPSVYPAIADAGRTIEEFIPQGWHFFDSTSGDLNKDKLIDLAFVLEQDIPEESDIVDANSGGEVYEGIEGAPRILVVVFAQKNGGYRRSTQANLCVLRSGEGGAFGDPWAGMEVDRGSLRLHFYGGSWWRWSLDYRFRFQDGGWFLIGATNLNYHSGFGQMESYDYNLLTGDVEITRGNVFGEECRSCDDCGACDGCEQCGDCETCVAVEDEVTRQNIGKKSLRSMEDFIPFEWEILPGHYI